MKTCSGTIQALKAGEEAPRCVRCDRLIPEHALGAPLDCGCPEDIYTVLPSPLSGQDQIVVTQDARAVALALSFGGRYIPAHSGYLLAPAKCALFEQFYAEGITAVRCYRNGPGWCYRFPGKKRAVNIYNAVKRLRGAK